MQQIILAKSTPPTYQPIPFLLQKAKMCNIGVTKLAITRVQLIVNF
jgi:hypothetical protein